MVSIRRQTIIWNKADPIHSRIYAALGETSLSKDDQVPQYGVAGPRCVDMKLFDFFSW